MSKGPKNALADTLAEAALQAAVSEQEGDDTPDEGNEAPGASETPSRASEKITLAELFAYNHAIVAEAILGSANTMNKSDTQQYRLKAADIALNLIAIGAQRQ